MAIELDHVIVSSRSKVALGPAARRAARRRTGRRRRSGRSPRCFVNDGLTLDFFETDESFPVEHFCFRVAPAEFDAILARLQAAGIAYRSKRARRDRHEGQPLSSAASTSTGTSRTATSGRC
jgi:hypothetical protein